MSIQHLAKIVKLNPSHVHTDPVYGSMFEVDFTEFSDSVEEHKDVNHELGLTNTVDDEKLLSLCVISCDIDTVAKRVEMTFEVNVDTIRKVRDYATRARKFDIKMHDKAGEVLEVAEVTGECLGMKTNLDYKESHLVRYTFVYRIEKLEFR